MGETRTVLSTPRFLAERRDREKSDAKAAMRLAVTESVSRHAQVEAERARSEAAAWAKLSPTQQEEKLMAGEESDQRAAAAGRAAALTR